MRKTWGWFMLVGFVLLAGITRYNLIRTGGMDADNWWKVCILGLIGVSLLLGWFRLVISKQKKEVK